MKFETGKSYKKNAFGQLTTTTEFKGNILNSVIGIASGYITKSLLGSTHNPIKKVLGTILQFAITNFVSKKLKIITLESNLNSTHFKEFYIH
jgi:hypothetical protein